jgi:hypothetical protein
MRLTVIAAAVGSAVALVGFAEAANASATIDLIWDLNGSDTIADVLDGSDIRLNVILTAGPGGSHGAGVSVDYSLSGLSVVSFASTPSVGIFSPLPFTFGPTTDTGSRVESINSTAIWNIGGRGLQAGQSHQLGTVTFNKGADVGSGVFEITSDANSPADGVLDFNGDAITSTTTFNSAFLDDEDPCSCDFVIDINALRGGSPTVAVNSTKDITAKARISKGSALPDTTVDTTLRIDAIDGSEVIDSQSSGPIQLEVGKGGQGDKLTMNINQCNSGSIIFEATFTPNTPICPGCEGWRTITKTCK